MTRLILRIYDSLLAHRLLRRLSLLALTALLVVLVVGQTYQEDISDFLPLNDKYHRALKV